MLNNCLRWFKVSLRTLTTEDSCLAHLLHDCYHTLPVKRDVKRPSRFTGNVWLATRYTTVDSVVYIGGLSAVVE